MNLLAIIKVKSFFIVTRILIYGNGGPARIRKKLLDGPFVVPIVQTNGIAGELVVKIAFQFIRLLEACIC